MLFSSLFSCPNNGPKTHDLKFNVWDKTQNKYVESSKTINHGTTFSSIEYESIPSDDIIFNGAQYRFKGWIATPPASESEPVIDEDIVITDDSLIIANTTYTAVYTLKETLSIQYMIYSGSAYLSDGDPQTVQRDTQIKDLRTTPSITSFDKHGKTYVFKGWTTTAPTSGFIKDIAIKGDTLIKKDLTLYAVYIEDYLTFTALADTQIAFNLVGYADRPSGYADPISLPNTISLQYKKAEDEGFKNYTWNNGSLTSVQAEATSTGFKSFATGDKITLKKGEKIYFKGNNTTFSYAKFPIAGDDTTFLSLYINFTSTGNVDASGNVMSLVNFQQYIPNEGCFDALFHDCQTLINAQVKLPSNELKTCSYRSFFDNCKGLKTVPTTLLPATILAEYCYEFMFKNCSSLTTAPSIDAQKVKYKSYQGMFLNCTSLERAPNLPATTLDAHCYESMFQGCTALQEAPELHAARVMKDHCYFRMFQDSGITKAPDLPSEELADSCYESMFEKCRSLTTIPTILPATTLKNKCYGCMFKDCSSIEIGPTLPATTANNNAYWAMFHSATKLKKIRINATSFSGASTRYLIFNNIETVGTLEVPSSATSIWTKATSTNSGNCYPQTWTLKGV